MSDTDVRAKFGPRAMMNALDNGEPGKTTEVHLSETALEIARYYVDRPISGRMVSGILQLVETLAVAALGLAVSTVVTGGIDWRYLMPVICGSLGAMVLINAAGGYSLATFRSFIAQAGRIFGAWTLVFVGFALALFFFKIGSGYSRHWFTLWFGAGLAFYLSSRMVMTHLVQRWHADGRLQRRAVLVGGGEVMAELIRGLEASPDNDIRICGIFDDRSGDRSPQVVQGYTKLGTTDELVEFGRIAKIDMLIVSLPITAEQRLLQVLKKLWVLPVDIRLALHTDKLRFGPRSYSYIGTVPFLDVLHKPIANWDSIVKRGFDLVVASMALFVLSPVMLATALAIKLDSRGPILFRQKRYGFNNEVIDVFKFRSMYADKCDYEAKVAVTRNDARVTRVGRFIRKTSIDELPQLLNVIIGNLSLVGPRPHAVGSNTENKLWESVVDGYFARHRVKPGVTGWAQVNGWRGEVDTPEKLRGRVEHDLFYIENWSPVLDLRILARTPFALFNTDSAY